MFRSPLPLLLCFISVFAGTLTAAPGEKPHLSVRFAERSIAITGRVDSEEGAQTLAAAARSARPDLKVVLDELVVDATAERFPLSDLGSLITELGLSTQDGWLEIWPDRVLVGGLTDSLVTLTALRLRLEPVRGERQFVPKIRVVETEDLPKIDVSHMNRESQKDSSSVNLSSVREQPFEVPGLLVEKLLPTLSMLHQFDRFEGAKPTDLDPPRAMPLELTETTQNSGPTAEEESSPTSHPRPGMPSLLPGAMAAPPQYEVLPSVFFSRNSFLLQANQEPVIAELTRNLLAPDRLGRTVLVDAVKSSGGSSAFNEYLCEKRAGEVLRLLTERGVDAATLQPGMVHSSSSIDDGQVTIRVEIPPSSFEPPAADTDEGGKTKQRDPVDSNPPDGARDPEVEPASPAAGLGPLSPE